MKRIEKLIKDGNFITTHGVYSEYIEVGGIPKRLSGNKEEILEYLLEEMPEPQKLTTLELELAKYLADEKYSWLARDENGELKVYAHNPYKRKKSWGMVVLQGGYEVLSAVNRLFQFIQWSDNEPTNLQELIDNCEVED